MRAPPVFLCRTFAMRHDLRTDLASGRRRQKYPHKRARKGGVPLSAFLVYTYTIEERMTELLF